MRTAIHALRVMVVALIGVTVALTASAQATQTGSASLSPGDQKIAQALFEAQTTNGSATPWTLDQIVAKKQGHMGWGEVFKQMKAQGLLTDKNLGQVVSRFERSHPELAAKPDHSKPEKLDKTDKPDSMGRMDKPERPQRPGR